MKRVELFGTAACPYTRDMREWLELRGAEFVEYDVETDRAARELYDRLGTTPVRDACLDDGSLTRQRNALRCTRHPEPGRYTCDFAIDARSGRLATGQAC